MTEEICQGDLEGEGGFQFVPCLDCAASPTAPHKEGSPGLGCLWEFPSQGGNYHHPNPPWAPLPSVGLNCVTNSPCLAAEMGPFQCPNSLLRCEPWEQQHKRVLTERAQVPPSKKRISLLLCLTRDCRSIPVPSHRCHEALFPWLLA